MILLSLSLQVFLFLFAGMRRRSSKWFLQTVLWLAYLSADSVAVFVLGHLAVRAREPGHELMSFWAPFVLVHLGGQETITAFSKQDNEMWRRHLLNLVIQAGVAGYVVAKASWPDARLRAAMVIMFACGCLKYAARISCLYLADTDRLRRWNKSLKLEGRLQHERGKGLVPRSNGTRDTAEENMRVTLEMMKKGSSSEPPSGLFWDAVALVSDIISMDAPLNQTQNITVGAYGDLLPGMLKGFLSSESRRSAYEHVGALLEHCYSRLYTKDVLRFRFIQPFGQPPQ
ncbi:unnamed protein product [Miscanthus lutarioriparius]|uniref:DUF4220 domain-containing protein n=1 Tax=Miscanthus lutarioriparius TaxID=422564 RepID=A0A811RQG8_9POAL|nr:unnamed protein product [Miscanthus lutarioriparius]